MGVSPLITSEPYYGTSESVVHETVFVSQSVPLQQERTLQDAESNLDQVESGGAFGPPVRLTRVH